jgi:TIR domain-containing protein
LVHPTDPARTSIFISYRRSDASGQAHRIADRIAALFGHERVFIDVQSLPPGEPFALILGQALRKTAALLVIIGPNWAGQDEARSRLFDENDFVRWEIREAIAQGLPILPVLVDAAVMPARESVPDDIRELMTRQAVVLRDPGFDGGVRQIRQFLRRIGLRERNSATALRRLATPAVVGLVETAALLLAVRHVAAPLVSWQTFFVDAWPYWAGVGLLVGFATSIVFERGRRGLLALAVACTVIATALIGWAYPAVTIVSATDSFGSADAVCEEFETDTGVHTSHPGVRFQGPAKRQSFCQGEAFAEKHFEIRIRTGWLYRDDLKVSIESASVPMSASPPVRLGDIAVAKSLAVLPPFLAPPGVSAAFHAIDRVPPEFIVLVTCWYDGSIGRPDRVQISVDHQANGRGIIRTTRMFPVDW